MSEVRIEAGYGMRRVGDLLYGLSRSLSVRKKGPPQSPEATSLVEGSLHRQVATPHPRLCAITDTGIVRSSNEDAFRVAAGQGLFVVADGMGGEQSGEIASFIAAETFMELSGEIRSAPEFIRLAFKQAQSRVLQRANADPACAGMGTAVVAAVLDHDLLHIGHLGDARAYLGHADNFRRLTNDHSAIAKAVVRGDLSWEDARLHPGRSTLYKAIGFEGQTEPDFSSVWLTAGDRVLLCSDGLWDELPDSEIGDMLASDGTVWELAHILVNRALAAGGHDNITVVLYEHSCSENINRISGNLSQQTKRSV